MRVRDLPTAVDGDGIRHIVPCPGPSCVVAVRLRDPHDAMTSEQLKEHWNVNGWGRAPFYEMRTGLLEALYWTDTPLPARQTTIDDFAELDTNPYRTLAPDVPAYNDEIYATISGGEEIPQLPQHGIDLVRSKERAIKEFQESHDASLRRALWQWNDRRKPQETKDDQAKLDAWPWLKEMNRRYAVTSHGGRTMVHEIVYDYALGHVRHQWSTFEDISKRHRGQIEKVPDAAGKVRAISRGDAWLESPERRQYDAEVFAPGRELAQNVLNLYTNLAVAPRRGRWDRLRAHLLETICGGDEKVFEYLLKWTARMFQRPGEPGQVAIVLKGDEGVGKGFFGRALARAWGQHGIHLSTPRGLVGNFNSHLDCKIYCFADEAIFAGNPETRGALYALITEDRLQIESKGVDVRTAANYLHIVMATNEDWAIPAGVNSRRFLVLDVNPKHRQDGAYFASLNAEMEAGALEAMIFDLMQMDLRDFDVFKVPQTAALADQKIMSLKGPERWLFDALQRGTIAGEPWTHAGCLVSKADAYNEYMRTSRDAGEKRPRDVATWSKSCKKALKNAWDTERPASGERKRRLILPGLAVCRAAFEKHFGHSLDWDAEDLSAGAPPGNAEEVF